MANEERKQLNPDDLDVESLNMDELEGVAGGNLADIAGGDINQNCHSCTCTG